MKFIRFGFVTTALMLTSCGQQAEQYSSLKTFKTLFFTANSSEPNLRIGYDITGATKISNFGNTVGSEFVINTYNNNPNWTPLTYKVDIAGQEAVAVVSLEFGKSIMPVYHDEDPNYVSDDWNDMGCSDSNEFKDKLRVASFQVRVRYTVNGKEVVKASERINTGNGATPSNVSLGIYNTEGPIKDLFVEIGAVQPRVAMGYCYYSEDQGSWTSKRFNGGTVFDLKIKKITIPYAVNKLATPG